MIFILSPASCSGKRAERILDEHGSSSLGKRLRTRSGVPLAEVFTSISQLYFRGKLEYATRFAGCPETDVFVIAPGIGLLAPQTRITIDSVELMANIAVKPSHRAFREPMLRSGTEVAATREPRIGFLGSLARGRYLELLDHIFGSKLVVPKEFVGLGSLSRGSRLRRCAREGTRLTMVGLDAIAPRNLQRSPIPNSQIH